jgi:putative transposase
MLDSKLVYKATSKDLTEHHLLELGEKWGKDTPPSSNPGRQELRRIIYTTNIVEVFHQQIHKQ